LSTKPPSRAQCIDALIALAVAAAVLPLLWPYRQPGFETLRGVVGSQTDEGTALYLADRIRRGAALYRDIWDFKGPVGHLPLALGLGVGEPGVASGRAAMLCVVALWSGATYLAVRQIAAARSVALAFALLPAFLFWPTWPYAYQDFSGQLWSTLAVACALAALRHPSAVVAAGACAALAFWTSLSQGLPALVGLGGAVVLTEYSTADRRFARRQAGRFLLGALAVSLVIAIWLAALGSLRHAAEAIFVFPFERYMTPYNQTAYGYDAPNYVQHWSAVGRFQGAAVHVLTSAIVLLPWAGLAAGVLIGAGLVGCAGFRLLAGRVAPFAPSRAALMRLTVPAAVTATFVPVALGKTRSDVCHIGFVCGTATLVLALATVRWPSGRPLRRGPPWMGRCVRAAAGGTFAILAAVAVAFHAHLLQRPYLSIDVDDWFRRSFAADLIAERTPPHDEIVALHSGGYRYLTSRRDAAIPYPMLWDDRYCEQQWPIAAERILQRLPPILLIQHGEFELLARHQPLLRDLYFGYSGNYMREERRPGPRLCRDGTWSYLAEGSRRELPLSLRENGAPANFVATLDGRALQGHVDEDRVAWFDADVAYVARLARDARSLRGRIYRDGRAGEQFRAVLAGCASDAQAALRR
jgi:hypothetical protein